MGFCGSLKKYLNTDSASLQNISLVMKGNLCAQLWESYSVGISII